MLDHGLFGTLAGIAALVVHACGAAYVSWLSASVISLFANSNAHVASATERMRVISTYMEVTRLPTHLVERVNRMFQYLWVRTGLVHSADLFEELPTVLRADLAFQAYGHLLESMPLFAGTDKGFLRALSLALRQGAQRLICRVIPILCHSEQSPRMSPNTATWKQVDFALVLGQSSHFIASLPSPS